MGKFKFLRRGEEVSRYNRAKSLLKEITFPTLRQKIEKEIHDFELKSQMIDFLTISIFSSKKNLFCLYIF